MPKKTKPETKLNSVELYCREYDPNLSDKSIREMVAFRRKENPAFDPVAKHWWSLGPMGCSYAMISLCIKEDFQQTASDLAYRLAENKKIPFTATAYVVSLLRKKGRLYFYDDDQCVHLWEPRVVVGNRSRAI